jgi:hypothetical protein
VAPPSRPGIAAPLGWVLSGMSRTDLDVQLDELVQSAGHECSAPLAVPDARGRTPGTLSTLLKLLKGPVTVEAR